MAYYLINKEKNNYNKIDITKMPKFIRLSNFKGDKYSLEELDLFTTSYQSEVELLDDFKMNNLITNDNIAIYYKKKEDYKKVRYNLVYAYNKKYLDPLYLRAVMFSLINDTNYLTRLASYYRNSYTSSSEIFQINEYIIHPNNYEINIYNTLEKFILKELYSTKKETGEVKLKYKSLHDLAMFTYNYLAKEQLIKNEKPKIKRKNLPLEGQTTLF